MPPKRPPAPVDRPLSKAYLRQFSGWSTNYPPGLSEPNSLRKMENVFITRDGGAQVRPGMRSLLREKAAQPLVGSFELFYTNEGEKAYLVAVLEDEPVDPDEPRKVGFRVITFDLDDPNIAIMQTLEEFGFELLNNSEAVEFDASLTGYVRYMQIDNKIFALSNGPEPMIMFWVGEEKKARRLAPIDRPEWDTNDQLTVRHPDAAWINNTVRTGKRINRCVNPSFVHGTTKWRSIWDTKISRVADLGAIGPSSMRLESTPVRTNYCEEPLHDIPTYGTGGWYPVYDAGRISIAPSGTSLRCHVDATDAAHTGAVSSEFGKVSGGERLRIGFDLDDYSNIDRWTTRIKFFNASKESLGISTAVGHKSGSALEKRRYYSQPFTVPNQARYFKIGIQGHVKTKGVTTWFDISNVFLGKSGSIADGVLESLSGDDGTDYFWEGTPGSSRSVYHPPRRVGARMVWTNASSGSYSGSAYGRTSTGGQTLGVRIHSTNTSGATTDYGTGTAVATQVFERVELADWSPPADTTRVDIQVQCENLARGETAEFDGVLLERSATVDDFFHGSYPPDTSTQKQAWSSKAHSSWSRSETFASLENPTSETKTADTLISSSSSANRYNFGFFYTISNDLGESAPSRAVVVKTQRPWSSWKWETADSNGEPSGTSTTVPSECADQLTVTMPQDVFNEAILSGATKWDAYFYTWGPNDPTPVSAIHFATVELDEDSSYGVDSWARLTPEQKAYSEKTPLVPTEFARVNSTEPSLGSQGLVANDRLILVGAPSDPAKISWSGGQLGAFYDFSPSVGGGSKQLTSGNLYLTACVKLWQNPQSVDTLTILNTGEDGHSNAYYMQPATITSLSESIQVMGFEQTTGMEGTSSPYGCEVVNNALYHPLKQAIVKSTANNYNINHKTVTDEVENVWQSLQNYPRIVSCEMNGRIYYLVHNPHGELLEDECRGNEIWVLDTTSKTPTWSRWLVQGSSLRKMTYSNRVALAIVRPDGIFTFDERRTTDEKYLDDDTTPTEVPIGWYLETNTQGANRAHDAWANLQQANVMFSSLLGEVRYGIRGKDLHGMDIDIEKRVVATRPPAAVADNDVEVTYFLDPQDFEDYFLVRKMMKEWVFYAGSIVDEVDGEEVPRYSSAQVNYVQYRYTPVTVNVGYEYGSVETFEYGRMAEEDATTESGTPMPYVPRGGVL